MRAADEWDLARAERALPLGLTGVGILRAALLFASIAVAFALLVAPLLDRQLRSAHARAGAPAGLDSITTGTVGSGNTYTIRRSVLQASPNAICVIHASGRRQGDC